MSKLLLRRLNLMKKVVYFFTTVIMLVVTMFACPDCKTQVYADDNIFGGFSSKSYALIDNDSGDILYAHNANQKMPVASICKLMTTLLTIENIESGKMTLDDKLVASAYACDAEGSQAFLDAGSEYSVKDLLKSVIVASANDSSIVLAEHIGGSEENFVKMMNKRAEELGMKNTRYANATGLEKANQYSTANDCAIILSEVSKHDIYKEDCKIWMDKLVHPSGRETELVNTNRLVRYYDNCVTGKTGFTDDAGYCLVSTAEKNGMNLTAVTLKCKDAPSRFKESIQLFEWGFNNFENKKVVDKTSVLEFELPVNKGKTEKVGIAPARDCYVVDKKGSDSEIELKYEIQEQINAPVLQGDVVGRIIVLKNGVVCDEIDVITIDNVEKQNYRDVITKIINNWEF